VRPTQALSSGSGTVVGRGRTPFASIVMKSTRSETGSGVTASHPYAAAGQYAVTLTVTEYGVSSGSTTKYVRVYGPADAPPTVGGTACGSLLVPNTWTASMTDASTDPDGGIGQVTVHWGDGTTSTGGQGATLTHTYLNAGAYTITHRAIDTIGQEDVRVCTVNLSSYSISGTVRGVGGTPDLANAVLTFTNSTGVVAVVYSGSDGTFSVGSLSPGTYDINVARRRYTFDGPAATIVVGPSSTGNNIDATGVERRARGTRKTRRR